MYPDEVLTVSKKGKTEVRYLVDCGKFVMYEYRDPKTGKLCENKRKLILLGGEKRELFLIPMKDGKRILALPQEFKGERGIWDGEKVVHVKNCL